MAFWAPVASATCLNGLTCPTGAEPLAIGVSTAAEGLNPRGRPGGARAALVAPPVFASLYQNARSRT